MQIFISYSSKDRILATRIAKELEGELQRHSGHDDWKVWAGFSHVYPGENWAKTISRGLESSQAMVVLVTPNYVNSDWILNDVFYAINNGRFRNRVIPVIAAKTPAKSVPGILNHFQRIEAFGGAKNEKEGVKKIVQALLKTNKKSA